jgi:hypothetical protein
MPDTNASDIVVWRRKDGSMKSMNIYYLNALVLAFLVIALAGTVVAADAEGEELCSRTESRKPETASTAKAGSPTQAVAPRKFPRGSFIDAML